MKKEEWAELLSNPNWSAGKTLKISLPNNWLVTTEKENSIMQTKTRGQIQAEQRQQARLAQATLQLEAVQRYISALQAHNSRALQPLITVMESELQELAAFDETYIQAAAELWVKQCQGRGGAISQD